MLEEYLRKTEPEYYPPVENLLDLIYEHYTENNPVEKNTVAGKTAKVKEKELEEWLRGLEGMNRLVDDYVEDKIPLWEKIMDRQGTVCCAWHFCDDIANMLGVSVRMNDGYGFIILRCKKTKRI